MALAHELGVAARVHVLGYRADASRYLPLADALALPSMNEGLPIVGTRRFAPACPSSAAPFRRLPRP